MKGLTSQDVCAATGLSYRQLDYWTRRGYVQPSIRDTDGSGSPRLWNKEDIKQIKRIQNYISKGYTLRGALEKVGQNDNASRAVS